MKSKLLSILLTYIVGIICFYNIDIYIGYLYLFCSLSLIVALYLLRKRKSIIISILILNFFLAGLLTNYKIYNSNLLNFANKNVYIQGLVVEKMNTSDTYGTYAMKVLKISHNNKTLNCSEKILLILKGSQNIEVGDFIKGSGKINEIMQGSNPKLFDNKVYFQSKNILSSITLNNNEYTVLKNKKFKFKKLTLKYKKNAIRTIESNLSEINSGIMKSIMFGDDTYLKSQTLDKFRKLGLSHILAVSGLHIGILSGFVILLLKFIKMNIKVSLLLSLITVWLYGFLLGYPVTVVRAFIMLLIFVMSKLVYKRYDIINSLLITAYILLLINPIQIYSIGYQLSFIIVMSLSLFSKSIENILESRSKLSKTFSALVAAQIGLIPISIYHFNYVSIFAIVSNLILVPFLTISLILSFILINISYISNIIVVYIGYVIELILNIFNYISKVMYNYLCFNYYLISPTITEIIVYYLMFLIAFKHINFYKYQKKINKVIIIYLFIIAISTNILNLNISELNINFVDVGQGDCILVSANNKNYIIDAGGPIFTKYNIGDKIVIPYLLKKGIKNIDGIFISHYDKDHCSAVPLLIEKLNVKRIFVGYIDINNDQCNDIINIANVNKLPINLIKKNSKIKISNDIEIFVLNPDNNMTNSDNNNSLVLLLRYYNFKILFTGDIEEVIENNIIEDYDIDIDLLKVAHHGSKTSSALEFIEEMNPEFAVFSVGKNNYGHPDKAILERYKKEDIKIFRTDEDGMIGVKLTKNSIKIIPHKRNKQNIYEFVKAKYIYLCYFVTYLLFTMMLINTAKKYIIVKV